MAYSSVEAKSIQELCKVIDCEHKTAPYVEKSDYLVVRTSNVRNGRMVMEDMKYTTLEGFKEWTQRAVPEAGDVLFTREAPAGESCLVPKDKNVCMGQRMVMLRPNREKVDPIFLSLVLATEKSKFDILRLSIGSTVSRINIADIKKLRIAAPPLLEQRKVAQILSTWDKAIATTEQMLTNSQQQKNALMQQLLTSKRRFSEFSEDWKDVYLGDIAKITTGSSNRQDSQLSGTYTFFDRSEDIRSSDRYLFDGEAVIVPGEGQDFVPKYFFGKFDLHQRTYAIMDFPTCDGKYLFYAIHYFRAHFLSQAVGSTVKSLRLPMFQKMKLHLPTLAEQKKIASILSNADQEIESLQQKLNYLKQEKKALMQQLLTGKRRVKMDAA
ncbi:TPA: restriction endonuclease subunit S [Citrobacter freundii]|nr:restriction endonuclease subunit S [Citrobacter freundii]HAT2485007.1 restriction endonuclease subunit S [Citrobacter freundii]HAT2719932.1 restriction endonuclease subunit S [Citrobacter freundii]HAT2730021.1 restriction endonuclease subunit S [Citrobacter freundii]HBC0512631.1 restriction endonuclease subunit S [Citrobacter freundii]